MTFTTQRSLLAGVGVALCLVLAACSTPATDTTAGDEPAAEESTQTAAPTGDAEGAACSEELDAIVSAGLSFERLTASEYTVASIAPEVLAAGCAYEFTTSGKVAQWAWFPGASTADVTDALVADGYTLSDTSETSSRYESSTGVSVTVAEGSAAGDPVFGLLGPYVGAYQDFN